MALLTAFSHAWAKVVPAGRWLTFLAALALLGLTGVEANAQIAPSREYQIKAVFIFNFLQFVEWPASAFPDKTSPIRIGILGNDHFGSALEETVRGETIHDRPLIVVRSRRAEDLLNCHLVFISESEARGIEAILSQLSPRPILTVSDVNGFARRGGVIAFYPEGKKVRFEINIDTAQRLGLKMSSQLLSLGKIVGSGSPEGQL
jgi:hypothetical protein